MGLNLYFCECDMQFYLFILTGSHIYINVWKELPNIGFFLKNPNLLYHFTCTTLYITNKNLSYLNIFNQISNFLHFFISVAQNKY